MSRNDRAAKRARHGTRGPGNRGMRFAAAVTAGALGFAIVFGTTYVERLQHSFATKDNSSLITANSDSPNAAPTVLPGAYATQAAIPVDSEAGNDLNVLLIGSDTRSGANGAIGGKVAGGMRSDTSIIMHISADRSRVDFLSIPRDMRVRVSDCKLYDGSTVKGWTGKFNIAFANGGKHGDESEAAACTMQTLQDLTGITFDHYAVVDFAGFENVINSVGGVPMCITKKIDDRRSHLHLKPGAQVLSGKKSLAYARVRHIGDGTDLQRIERQQELLTNLAKKVLGMNVLTDAPQLTLLLKSAGASMTMDPKLGSFTYLMGLGYSMRNIDQDNINFMTVPWRYAGDKSGDVLATDKADDVFKRLATDVPMDGGVATPVTTATPDASTSPGASVAPSPERQTQDEILAACAA